MNAPEKVEALLTAERVQQARAQSHAGGPYSALSEVLGLPAEELAREAANYFGFLYLDMQKLHECRADFGVIRFVDAAQRLCAVLVAADGTRFIALADPLDARLHSWAVQRLRLAGVVDARWGLCLADDLRAFLAVAERSLRAMDTVGLAAPSPVTSVDSGLSMSIADISGASSPIVRLLDSTIHDALKSS